MTMAARKTNTMRDAIFCITRLGRLTDTNIIYTLGQQTTVTRVESEPRGKRPKIIDSSGGCLQGWGGREGVAVGRRQHGVY